MYILHIIYLSLIFSIYKLTAHNHNYFNSIIYIIILVNFITKNILFKNNKIHQPFFFNITATDYALSIANPKSEINVIKLKINK